MARPKSMRGRELERVERSFLLAAGLRCERERRVESFISFWCFTRGMRKGRELLESSFFEEVRKRNKMESCLSFKVWTRGLTKWT